MENFDLKNKWVLWFHKTDDKKWSLSSYIKVIEIKTYFDLLFVLKDIHNITCGMFFLMKDGINPIYEDEKNINGGYWSIRITKKESYDFWEKLVYYMCIDHLTIDPTHEVNINGISLSPKINNCIFKIWTDNYKNMNTKYMRNDLNFIDWSETFYLEHSDNSGDKK